MPVCALEPAFQVSARSSHSFAFTSPTIAARNLPSMISPIHFTAPLRIHNCHRTKNRPGAHGSSNRRFNLRLLTCARTRTPAKHTTRDCTCRLRSRNTASKYTIQSAYLDNECDWQLLHHSGAFGRVQYQRQLSASAPDIVNQ